MTSNSDKKNRILETIVSSLSDLRSYGFSFPPRVIQDHWTTIITMMLTDIALEIEIDWRDCDIFFLFVRLENGNLPSGYYVSGGLPCRYHLQKVIADRKWDVNQEALRLITPEGRKSLKGGRDSESNLLDKFRAYKNVLDSCIEFVVKDEGLIFSS